MTEQSDTLNLAITIDVNIRQLRKEDLRKLEWYGEFLHYRRLFMRSYQGQLRGTRHLLVADVRGFPVGRLFIQFESPRKHIADGHSRGYLYSFHIMEMFRGQGIGTHLIHAAESMLLAKGFHTATIAVSRTNHGARRLYQRYGYVIIDQEEGKWQYYDHLGKLHRVHDPCWLLEKKL